MDVWRANLILRQLIEPTRTLEPGSLVYDDQDLVIDDYKALSSQVYRIEDSSYNTTYFTQRVDINFYDTGEILAYFVLNDKIVNEIQTDLSGIYDLGYAIADFMETPRSEIVIYEPTIKGKYVQSLSRHIRYSELYSDDLYDYLIVTLSRKAYRNMLKSYGDRLLTEEELQEIGILQNPGWEHIYNNRDNTELVFRRSRL